VKYVGGLAPLEFNDSGRLFRTAAERFTRISQSVSLAPPPPANGFRRLSIDDRLGNSCYAGWPRDDRELDEWLTKSYENDRNGGEDDEAWYIQALKASQAGDGIFEHPLRAGTVASNLTQQNGRRMGVALLVHGLQKQAQGQPEEFLADLRVALSLGRSLRTCSVVSALGYGQEVGRLAMAASEQWTVALQGRPDLLRAAISVIQQDDPDTPFDPRPHLLSERYLMRDQAKAPAQWLPAQLTPPGRDRERVAPLVDLIGVAWNVPWERERTRRLLGLGFEGSSRQEPPKSVIRGRPGASIFAIHGHTAAEMTENDRLLRTNRRAMILSLAIRIYEIEHGAPPASLGDLVSAGCLTALPSDPYIGDPFHYRLAVKGEKLESLAGPVGAVGAIRPPAQAELQEGQAVLWSVGPDRADSGGTNAPTRFGTLGGGRDIVFIVPRVPAK
jgi:hypothetical protein